MYIKVVRGDITRTVPVDAIVTLINPGGTWFGGVDGAIQRVAGDQYHSQAREVLIQSGLVDMQVLVAEGNGSQHQGQFNDVVFVVDALETPVGILVQNALNAVKDREYQAVAFPAIRTGVMRSVSRRTRCHHHRCCNR